MFINRVPFGGNHGGDYHLSPAGLRDAHDRRIRHGIVLFQGGFHFGGRNVEPAGNDNFLNTIHDLDEVVFVQAHNIAGAQPAVSRNGFLRVFLAFPVPSETLRAVNPQLALFAERHILKGVGVYHANIG